MSANPTATPRRARTPEAGAAGGGLPAHAASTMRAPAPALQAHGCGGRVLFEVPFTSAMGDADLALLARLLDLSTHMSRKMRPDPTSPGVVRLDHFSGLFLERGADEGQWVLQARTWDHPAAPSVHEWHLLAAQAARRLDPRVTMPQRLPHTHREIADRPLGQAASKRPTSIRRHLVGLT
jgi:hypothetical protein